jgi:hypothetical protein
MRFMNKNKLNFHVPYKIFKKELRNVMMMRKYFLPTTESVVDLLYIERLILLDGKTKQHTFCDNL